MKNDCTNCGNAEWQKTKTGRRKIVNGYADCTVEVEFPLSYMNHYNNFPSKSSVYSHTCRDQDCSFWKPVEKGGSCV